MTRIVLLDFETTGLDPSSDEILEVGAIMVDNELGIVSSYQSLVCPHRLPITVMTNKAVFEMHKASGLTDELMKFWATGNRRRIEDVEGDLLAWMMQHGCVPQEVEIAGYSVHFDRSFIAERMPDLHRFLSHRMLNISSFRTAFKLWSGEEAPKQESKHRALEDCHDALRELAFYKLRFFSDSKIVRRIGHELKRYLLEEHTDEQAPFGYTPRDIGGLLQETQNIARSRDKLLEERVELFKQPDLEEAMALAAHLEESAKGGVRASIIRGLVGEIRRLREAKS